MCQVSHYAVGGCFEQWISTLIRFYRTVGNFWGRKLSQILWLYEKVFSHESFLLYGRTFDVRRINSPNDAFFWKTIVCRKLPWPICYSVSQQSCIDLGEEWAKSAKGSDLQVQWSINAHLKLRARVALYPVSSHVPRPLPDFISQLWKKICSCEIKFGSGQGTRLPPRFSPQLLS